MSDKKGLIKALKKTIEMWERVVLGEMNWDVYKSMGGSGSSDCFLCDYTYSKPHPTEEKFCEGYCINWSKEKGLSDFKKCANEDTVFIDWTNCMLEDEPEYGLKVVDFMKMRLQELIS